MDFIVGLARTQSGFDSIWVVVDKLTKVAHFIPVKNTYTGAKLAELYISRIVCLHGVSKKIVSDRGTQFTSHFWKRLHESMDTKLNFSSAYHPQTDGQTERTNQILEEMLRAFIRLVSRCRLFKLCTADDAECRYTEISHQIFGLEIAEDAERQVQIVKENLRIAQTRQKSYEGHRRRDLEFAAGDYGEVAYQLELPDKLSGVHDVFHVSQLKKCLWIPEEQLQMDDLNMQDDLTYTEYPVQILETAERVTRKRVIKMCKVKWSHHSAEEAKWEREDLRGDYPELFASQS
ncbi:LOW QUALITY PROTEIN: hypothetical protein U9M48_028602 [Paspalum notatum var. saurae]|uniref:Integrase catalytic domain-containing protein n=1 Tax=Paspalum notatum var. saurae TaxID=547442 RepID=A0AAQ3X1L4_PASNO